MAEYDDTNRGAAFTPFPTQQMILQGKVNVEGIDSKVVLVKDQTKDGRGIVEVYQKMAVMFDNDKKDIRQRSRINTKFAKRCNTI